MPILGVGTDQFIFNPDGDSNPLNVGKVNFTTAGTQSAHRMGELHFVKINKPGQVHDKTIVEGDINGNGHPDFQIELTGLITLSKGDFIL